MISDNGSIFKIYQKYKTIKTKVIWRSQKKLFKHIGSGGGVSGLPFISGYNNIFIGNNCFLGEAVRMEAWTDYRGQSFSPQIIIGNNVIFTDRCYLSCIDKIEIGHNVLLGRDVFITDNSHGNTTVDMLLIPPVERKLTSKGSVKIGNNVWIGRQVTVLSGVTIGDNSIIGANSVVNKSIPSNCVAVGNPARVIKMLEVNH